MDCSHVRAQIRNAGIIPSVRVPSAEDALFAAQSVFGGQIPIAEISVSVPGAAQTISELSEANPEAVIGAAGILDVETARRCVDAGAVFLATDCLIAEVVKFAHGQGVAVISGALTPTEVVTAWRAGSDFVKVVPCAAVGGPSYIGAISKSLAPIPLIAAGGVNQHTAPEYLGAGAIALGIGQALFPWEAVALRQANRIRELARRFRSFVSAARQHIAQPEVSNEERISMATISNLRLS